MTHKYDKVSKVITEILGDNHRIIAQDNCMHYILDHGNLVHFAYAVLEEFEKEEQND